MTKVGRPSTYTIELAQDICDAVAHSPKMLEEICEENPNFPVANTVYKWRLRHAEFGEMFARAKMQQIEPLVNTVISKARAAINDFYDDGEGKRCVNHAAIQRLRIELDNIKWYASKLAPKIYGMQKIEIGAEQSLLEKIVDKL